jgi:Bacterial transcriptional regulator.
MSAVAVPVIGPEGRPIAAFAVAAITERIVGERLGELVALLRAEAANLAAIFDLNRTTQ